MKKFNSSDKDMRNCFLVETQMPGRQKTICDLQILKKFDAKDRNFELGPCTTRIFGPLGTFKL